MDSHPTTPDATAIPTPGAESSQAPAPSTDVPGASESQSTQRLFPGVDPETGKLCWIPFEEWQARHEEYKRRLAEIDAEDDTPEEVYDQFMRNIDEERRRLGRPPAFEGYY